MTRSQTKSANSGSRAEGMKENTIDNIRKGRSTWDEDEIAKRNYKEDPGYKQAIEAQKDGIKPLRRS